MTLPNESETRQQTGARKKAAERYAPAQTEPALQEGWLAEGIYHFQAEAPGPIYAIDTPPPTVSGKLHLGHVYSYSHADFMARFFRMRGYNVYYPMGFDDNGLPTERLVEKTFKIRAAQVGRQAFIEKCLEHSEEAEKEYRALWQRLGLSVDWRYTYRTIGEAARRASQYSFIELYRKGLVYRSQAPAIWCPECRTGIAQADLNDLERSSEFVTLLFRGSEPGGSETGGEGGRSVPIATTRPELLAACVAVFVHPQDARYQELIGQQVSVPLYGQRVPVLADPAADPAKGTGAVMCCTFGDQTDVAWQQAHRLPLIEAIDSAGKMLPVSGELAGLGIMEARQRIKEMLAERGLILARQPTRQSVRVHERCDTPVEYLQTPQWFIRILDHKEKFLELGRQARWHPEHMQARYQAWVENLNWDWCISRRRFFGVPFPVWYCRECGATLLADESQLPVDPLVDTPLGACACGSRDFEADTDVLDTWATSSVSPMIAAGWLEKPERFERLFPMTMRPQAHEIIRTWAFYTIVKSYYHFGRLPWTDVFISGWGIAAEGMGKISKSRGGGPLPPLEMIERYSADAVRYWAASTSPGKDAVISEDKIQMGAKLANKLWNVARFARPFMGTPLPDPARAVFTPADRWILARCRSLVADVTAHFEGYDYASAKNAIESFFWHDLADNYLEMAKQRLYDGQHPAHDGARLALRQALKVLLKLLAPLLPYVTDAIYREENFQAEENAQSIHATRWPRVGERNSEDLLPALPEDEAFGEVLVAVATAARRYKSEHAASLSSELPRLHLACGNPAICEKLRAAIPDLSSVARARLVTVGEALEPGMLRLESGLESGDFSGLEIGLEEMCFKSL